MFEWHKTIQKMINTIEEELDYGLTPNEYRKRKMPLMLKNKQNIFNPYYLGTRTCWI